MRLSAGTSTKAMRLIVFCVLSILGGTSVAMDETASELSDNLAATSYPVPLALQAPRYSSLISPQDQLLGGKRAYVYRSEFKRLPLYQFGLGKRFSRMFDDKRPPFSFGLGKRMKHYNFGIGKRDSYDDYDGNLGYNYDYIPNERYSAFAQNDPLDNFYEMKRTGGFNFGLGKRMVLEDEKLSMKNLKDKYLFGLGKRMYRHPGDEVDDDES